MLSPGKGKTHTAFMWVVTDGYLRYYSFSKSRKHDVAEKILKGAKGYFLHSDKYQAYEKIQGQNGIVWCPCWAHIRRKFFEANTNSAFRDWVLDRIKLLYDVEKKGKEEPDKILLFRQEQALPIIGEIVAAVEQRLRDASILPKSNLGKALSYFRGLQPYVKNYTQHASASIDNSEAERAMRCLAIGRKNWLFTGSEDGGRATAVILSLVQTCRGLDVNPREYLEWVMTKILDHSNQRLAELLPDAYLAHHVVKPTLQNRRGDILS
jgi:hypothetical protein